MRLKRFTVHGSRFKDEEGRALDRIYRIEQDKREETDFSRPGWSAEKLSASGGDVH